MFSELMDLVLHLDQYLQTIIATYGVGVYGILFAIIFCETGLVVMPFLPGDSLLFVTGALAASGSLELHTLLLLLMAASFLGDNTNYWLGRFFAPRLFSHGSSRWLNPDHLETTKNFFHRYGAKTVMLGRFLPIVRTFTPFVAGMSRMPVAQFMTFAAFGAVLWIGSLVMAGYFFGNIFWVKHNLTLVILGIIVLSLLPGLIQYWRARRASNA